jgi:hypothetical protein
MGISDICLLLACLLTLPQTVQETILPRSKLVLYGPVQLPWELLLQAANMYEKHRMSECCKGFDIGSLALDHLRDKIAELDKTRFDQMRAESNANDGVVLEKLLRSFRYRDASLQKDKVYALLPLLSNPEILVPDYSKKTTAEEVFTKAALMIIETTRTLDIFCQTPVLHLDKFRLLPSWVPNLSETMGFLPGTADQFQEHLKLYNASNSQAVEPKHIELNILVVRGIRLDTLGTVAFTIYRFPQSQRKQCLQEWLQFANKHSEPTTDTNHLPEAFVRTVCGDIIAKPGVGYGDMEHERISSDEDHRQAEIDIRQQLDLQPQATESILASTQEHVHTTSVVQATCTGRKFFVSKNRKTFGLCSSQAMPEDEIYVLLGGKTPFALRPVGARHIPGLGMRLCHQLIGQCYFHGYMDGQALDMNMKPSKIYLV